MSFEGINESRTTLAKHSRGTHERDDAWKSSGLPVRVAGVLKMLEE